MAQTLAAGPAHGPGSGDIMRRTGRLAAAAALALVVLGAVVLLILAPTSSAPRLRERAPSLPADLDAYLQAREQALPDLVAGTEARILWAGDRGTETDLSIVYLHGFSATAQEVRPLPDAVAAALGANLFLARLAGHGRSGAALAEASAEDWLDDLAEALAIGRRIGRRVVLIGSSTGGSLALIAATDPELSERLAGLVLLSPNLGLPSRFAGLLAWPGAAAWVPWLLGEERGFTPGSEAHARFWTERYPTRALVSLATLLTEVRAIDPATAVVPALFLYSESDRVIDPALIPPVAAAWGAPAQLHVVVLGPGDDPAGHTIAGDILSPARTAPLVNAIVDWIRRL